MTVTVHCGDAIYKSFFERGLETQGIHVGNNAEFQLLVDKPTGWGLLDDVEANYSRCIVLSDNLCPTYRLDLLERKPAALIALDDESVLSTLKAIHSGNTVYPRVQTPLTPAERHTLRLVALGQSNKKIAKIRKVSESTVENSLSSIYKKLDIRSRVQAAHYYFGNWHLLSDWEPPTSVA